MQVLKNSIENSNGNLSALKLGIIDFDDFNYKFFNQDLLKTKRQYNENIQSDELKLTKDNILEVFKKFG